MTYRDRRVVHRHRRQARDRRHRRPPRPRAGRRLGLQRRQGTARTSASSAASSRSGVTATMRQGRAVALKPDCIVHTAMTDDRTLRGARPLRRSCSSAGINVVSSGPVFLQYPHGIIPDDMVEQLHEAASEGGASPARQRHRPRLRQRRAAAGDDVAVAAHRRGALSPRSPTTRRTTSRSSTATSSASASRWTRCRAVLPAASCRWPGARSCGIIAAGLELDPRRAARGDRRARAGRARLRHRQRPRPRRAPGRGPLPGDRQGRRRARAWSSSTSPARTPSRCPTGRSRPRATAATGSRSRASR